MHVSFNTASGNKPWKQNKERRLDRPFTSSEEEKIEAYKDMNREDLLASLASIKKRHEKELEEVHAKWIQDRQELGKLRREAQMKTIMAEASALGNIGTEKSTITPDTGCEEAEHVKELRQRLKQRFSSANATAYEAIESAKKAIEGGKDREDSELQELRQELSKKATKVAEIHNKCLSELATVDNPKLHESIAWMLAIKDEAVEDALFVAETWRTECKTLGRSLERSKASMKAACAERDVVIQESSNQIESLQKALWLAPGITAAEELKKKDGENKDGQFDFMKVVSGRGTTNTEDEGEGEGDEKAKEQKKELDHLRAKCEALTISLEEAKGIIRRVSKEKEEVEAERKELVLECRELKASVGLHQVECAKLEKSLQEAKKTMKKIAKKSLKAREEADAEKEAIIKKHNRQLAMGRDLRAQCESLNRSLHCVSHTSPKENTNNTNNAQSQSRSSGGACAQCDALTKRLEDEQRAKEEAIADKEAFIAKHCVQLEKVLAYSEELFDEKERVINALQEQNKSLESSRNQKTAVVSLSWNRASRQARAVNKDSRKQEAVEQTKTDGHQQLSVDVEAPTDAEKSLSIEDQLEKEAAELHALILQHQDDSIS